MAPDAVRRGIGDVSSSAFDQAGADEVGSAVAGGSFLPLLAARVRRGRDENGLEPAWSCLDARSRRASSSLASLCSSAACARAALTTTCMRCNKVSGNTGRSASPGAARVAPGTRRASGGLL